MACCNSCAFWFLAVAFVVYSQARPLHNSTIEVPLSNGTSSDEAVAPLGSWSGTVLGIILFVVLVIVLIPFVYTVYYYGFCPPQSNLKPEGKHTKHSKGNKIMDGKTITTAAANSSGKTKLSTTKQHIESAKQKVMTVGALRGLVGPGGSGNESSLGPKASPIRESSSVRRGPLVHKSKLDAPSAAVVLKKDGKMQQAKEQKLQSIKVNSGGGSNPSGGPVLVSASKAPLSSTTASSSMMANGDDVKSSNKIATALSKETKKSRAMPGKITKRSVALLKYLTPDFKSCTSTPAATTPTPSVDAATIVQQSGNRPQSVRQPMPHQNQQQQQQPSKQVGFVRSMIHQYDSMSKQQQQLTISATSSSMASVLSKRNTASGGRSTSRMIGQDSALSTMSNELGGTKSNSQKGSATASSNNKKP